MHSNIPKSIINKSGRIYMTIKAKPGSKKEGITGLSIKAQPVDGEANKAIIKYLSEIIGISKSNVVIERGGTSKHKIVSLDYNTREEEIISILENNKI